MLGAGDETGFGLGVETGLGEGVDTGLGELVEGELVLPELEPELDPLEPELLEPDELGCFVVVVVVGTLQRGFSGSTGGSYGFGCFVVVVVVVVPDVVPEPPPTVSLPTVPEPPPCVIG